MAQCSTVSAVYFTTSYRLLLKQNIKGQHVIQNRILPFIITTSYQHQCLFYFILLATSYRCQSVLWDPSHCRTQYNRLAIQYSHWGEEGGPPPPSDSLRMLRRPEGPSNPPQELEKRAHRALFFQYACSNYLTALPMSNVQCLVSSDQPPL